MPKVKSSLRNKISSWIAQYNKSKETFSTDGKIFIVSYVIKTFHQKKIFWIIILKQVNFAFYTYVLLYFIQMCLN